jgi:heat shock protein HslJ
MHGPAIGSLRPLLGLLALAGSFVACARDAQTASAPAMAAGGAETTAGGLRGTEWRLEDLAGAAVLDRPHATLAFPESGQVAGSGSCNRFSGSVEVSGDSIRLGPLASTRMACPEPVSTQEARYLGALQDAERFAFDGTALLIHCRGLEKPLRFVRASP